MNTLDFYFDFSDPFSYIAGKRLIDFMEANQVTQELVNFRSFQLKPNDNNKNTNYLSTLMKQANYTDNEEYIEYFNVTIGKEATESGISIDIPSVIATNSIHAHAGLHFAKRFGLHIPYFLKVMDAHFHQGIDYYDLTFIKSVLSDLGLDADFFVESLKDLIREVNLDRFEGLKIGLQVVPSLFIKDNLATMGMGGNKAFKSAFNKLESLNNKNEASK